MRKRILIAVAAVATLSLIGATVATGSDDFIDVPDSNIFHEDISWMADNGITFGYGDGTYGPGDDVSRAQMAAFMHRLYDRIQQDIPDLSDPDVINEIAQVVNIESVCEVFGFEPGSQECEDGLAAILEGDQGPTGPQGPAGVNEVITDSIGLGSSVVTVDSISLPEGNWMVAANATAEATGPQAPVCALVVGETVLAKVNPASEDDLPTRVGVSLTAAVEGGGEVSLACNEAANAFDSTISAIGG